MESKAPDIIYFANEFGPLTHRNLADLTRMHPISVRRILPRLVKQKRLYCMKQGMHKPHIYATYNITHRSDFIHDLARADVAAALHNTGLMTYWHQPRQKLSRGKSVNEDARFELSVEVGTRIALLRFYLELDTGTEGYGQIEDKLKRYLALKDSSQVLFVVKFNSTKAHRTLPQTLAQLAERFIRKSDPHMWAKFLFADYERFLADPLERVCHIPYDPERHSILCALVE